MERSIKRVENLVHATNSALARMKFNLMFDDLEAKRKTSGFVRNDLEDDELRACQAEFKSGANEMLAKMSEMVGGNKLQAPKSKNLEAVEKIKKINKKMNNLQLEQTEESRQELLSLMKEEKLSPGMSGKKTVESSRPLAAYERKKEPLEKPNVSSRKTESVVSFGNSTEKTKLELKDKILETQEIVCRGFQTARRLAAKVESLTNRERNEKTPSTGKTVSEMSLKGLEGKSESCETLKAVKCNHSKKRERNKRGKHVDNDKVNAQVMEVKRLHRGEPMFNLQIQRLPSLHIKGGLTVQKIHSLEIPPSKKNVVEKTNTAICFLTHEQLAGEKSRKFVEEVWREHHGCEERDARGKSIECFNCGNIINLRQETLVDSQRLEEILLECNFNVSDPRIDEFVEKHGKVEDKCSTIPTSLNPTVTMTLIEPKTETKQTKKKKRVSHRELSSRVLSQYQEVVENLEDNHFKVNRILQEIFKKVDESRHIFEECNLFRNFEFRKSGNLSATKPVLITWNGRRKKGKLEKSDIKTYERRSVTAENKSGDLEEMPWAGFECASDWVSEIDKKLEAEERPLKTLNERGKSETPENVSKMTVNGTPFSSPSSIESQSELKWTFELEEEVEKIQSKSGTPSEKSENYYESDFESEAEENLMDGKEVLIGKQLSAILEVDSELEKKTTMSQEDTLRDVKNETEEGEGPLENILSALKNQFERTESLADNLTRGVGKDAGNNMSSQRKLCEKDLEQQSPIDKNLESEMERDLICVSLSENGVFSEEEITVTERNGGTFVENFESESKEIYNS